jgi:hypothetical protein
VSLQDIVNVQISATSAGPARQSFGTPLVVAYHTRWGASADRVRRYTSIAGMVSDGFIASDPAYKMAQAMFSQVPRVRAVKVGRRVQTFTQVVEITPSAPSAGEEYSLSVNGATALYTADSTPTLAEVCTGQAAAITAAGGADVDAIHSGTSTAGPQTITVFNGVIGGRLMAQPRALCIVISAHANWDATVGTIVGKDGAGRTLTQTFNIPDGGNTTINISPLFARVTEIDIPTQSGTNGTFTVGVQTRVTADGSSGTKIVCTATTAGELVDYSALSSNLSAKDATTDPGIAEELDDIVRADGDWWGLVIDSNSKTEIEATAAWAEDHEVLFVCQSADSAIADSASTTDVAAELQAAAYARTHGEYVTAIAKVWRAAALLGDRLPDDPGSDTWAFKTLAGIPVDVLTDTQKANVLAKNFGTYTTIAGLNVTEGAKVSAGEWVDVIRFLDWLRARARERIFALLTRGPKLAYTDGSVDTVKAELLGVLNDGIRAGGLAATPAPTVSAPLVADVDEADRQNRLLPDVEFSARLAGAIHALDVTGSVSV